MILSFSENLNLLTTFLSTNGYRKVETILREARKISPLKGSCRQELRAGDRPGQPSAGQSKTHGFTLRDGLRKSLTVYRRPNSISMHRQSPAKRLSKGMPGNLAGSRA